jgi:hypothetical protein
MPDNAGRLSKLAVRLAWAPPDLPPWQADLPCPAWLVLPAIARRRDIEGEHDTTGVALAVVLEEQQDLRGGAVTEGGFELTRHVGILGCAYAYQCDAFEHI